MGCKIMISKRDWDRDRLRSYWAENPGPRSFNFAGPLGALLMVTENIVFGTFQTEQDAPVSESSPHIANIGRMVEDMENKIR